MEEYEVPSLIESKGPHAFEVNYTDIALKQNDTNEETATLQDHENNRLLGHSREMERRKLITMERENPDAEIDDQSWMSLRDRVMPQDGPVQWAKASWTNVIGDTTDFTLFSDENMYKTDKGSAISAEDDYLAPYKLNLTDTRGGAKYGPSAQKKQPERPVVDGTDQIYRALDPIYDRNDPLTKDHAPWWNEISQATPPPDGDKASRQAKNKAFHSLINNNRAEQRRSDGYDNLAIFQRQRRK